jgi:predicted FMN-binding regulatory protein PaiB
MLRGIVGFRFVITRLEGKWKMSQNAYGLICTLLIRLA